MNQSIDSKQFESYARIILLLNAAGDILLATVLILLPGSLAGLLGFTYTTQIGYIAGGWGVGTLILGLTRLYASRASTEIAWFTALFGMIEGLTLTIYGLGYNIVGLPFTMTSLSTLFALSFFILYSGLFLVRFRHRLR